MSRLNDDVARTERALDVLGIDTERYAWGWPCRACGGAQATGPHPLPAKRALWTTVQRLTADAAFVHRHTTDCETPDLGDPVSVPFSIADEVLVLVETERHR